MNRTNLLATGAIVALSLATGTSMAQQERGTPPPAEKMAPSGAKQPSGVNRQNDERQNTPAGPNESLHGRIGEAPQNRGRPQTSGQAPREDRPNRPNEGASEPKHDETEQAPRSERNGPAPATGQAPHEERRSPATEENRATGQAPREDEKNHASEQKGFEEERRKTDREENRGTVGKDAAGTRANISITPEKRTQIHEAIIHERNAPRVGSVNFDISVGTRVPRGMRFATLPEPIIEIEPAWRGFEYFLVGEKIVIVDPTSMEIVAFIDA